MGPIEIILNNRTNMIIHTEVRVAGEVLSHMDGFNIFWNAQIVFASARILFHF